MAINAGESPAKRIFWGPDEVKRIYLGEAEVYYAQSLFYSGSRAVSSPSSAGTVLSINKRLDCNVYEKIYIRGSVGASSSLTYSETCNLYLNFGGGRESLHCGRVIVTKSGTTFEWVFNIRDEITPDSDGTVLVTSLDIHPPISSQNGSGVRHNFKVEITVTA